MEKLEVIRSKQIEDALEKEYRQYLTGHLVREQKLLSHIDDDIEIGISHYTKFTADKPHMHPVATEHGFVLCGSVRMRLLDGSEREYEFNEGDFFVLQPGVGYATKNKANTKVLFIKSPGGNDKTELPIHESVRRWLRRWN